MTIKRRFFLFNILIIPVHKTLKAVMAALKESYETVGFQPKESFVVCFIRRINRL